AGGPLAAAQKIAEALQAKLAKLSQGDRVAIWTANVEPRALTRGFVPARSLGDALKALNQEYPSGATNLKGALQKAVATFDNGEGRQRVVLFLGDGRSLAGPIDSDDRTALGEEMVKRGVAFYSVPLGPRLELFNPHGLPNAPGGKVVRLRASEGAEDFVARLLQDFRAPVLYPHTLKLPGEVVEAFPTRLPPLRSDVPTLVVGKIKPAKELSYVVAGTVDGKETRLNVTEKMPPPETEHFFLVNMVNQWRAQKDRPALMQADRALAYAAEQVQFARADLVAKAELALDQDNVDAAVRLYHQALQVEPGAVDAKAGLSLAEKLQKKLAENKNLKVKDARRELAKEFEDKAGDVVV